MENWPLIVNNEEEDYIDGALDLITCYRRANTPGYDYYGYNVTRCTGEFLIWLMTMVNIILVGVIMLWHFKEKGCSKKTFSAIKTWMLISLQSFLAIVFTRYTSYDFGPKLYTIILILNSCLSSLTLFLVCYYYVSLGLK